MVTLFSKKLTAAACVLAAMLFTGCQPQEPSRQETTAQAPPTTAAVSLPHVEGTPQKLVAVQAISQYPELPTGCEVTSLAVALQYYGVAVDKCDIADNYLDKGDVGTVDFYEAFEGDPRDDSSFGCYAPVIVNAANCILTERGSGLRAVNVSGQPLESLFAYLDKDMPVIIWGTQNCEPGQYTVTWYVDGRELTWFSPEHCMVLAGYSADSVWVADPLKGEIVRFDRELFQSCYESLYQQAVIIQ